MTETASASSFPQLQVAHVDNKEPLRPLTSTASGSAATPAGALQPKPPVPAPPSRRPSLHSHRQSNNASRLPSFRVSDSKQPAPAASPLVLQSPPSLKQPVQFHRLSRPASFSGPPKVLPDPTSALRLAAAVGQIDRDALATALTTRSASTHTNPTSDSLANPTHPVDPTGPTDPAHPTTSTQPAPPHPTTAAAPPEPQTPGRPDTKPLAEQSDSTAPQRSLRTRASSYQTKTQSSNIAEQTPRVLRRPVSVPESLAEEAQDTQSPPASLTRTPSTRKTNRRPPASYSSNGVATSSGPPPSLSTQRRQPVDGYYHATTSPAEAKTPRERDPKSPDASRDQSSDLPLLASPMNINDNSNSNSNSSEKDKKIKTGPESEPGTPGSRRVPPPTPKRSSRLVNHRKSVTPDMALPSRNLDYGSDSVDVSSPPFSRGLENAQQGFDVPASSSAPPASASQSALNNDDTGDVFLKIASEESMRRSVGDSLQSSVTGNLHLRTSSSTNRRPQSTFMPSYRITSPPRLRRQLSDYQDLARFSRDNEEETTSEVARSLAYRRLVGKAGSSNATDESPAAKSTNSGLRPSPISPQPLDGAADTTGHRRRGVSITEHGLASPIVVQSQHKIDGPSSFVRAMGIQGQGNSEHLSMIEGTESTGSTTGPSTVWDELDDLKSRIHRLELTGKLPPTSSAAVMKGQEDRPTTATTAMTTMSVSPRKSVAGLQLDVSSNASSQKETNPHHPNLHSALSKTKSFLSPEIYRALETAANDALALSSMMGAPGQPGPISSAAGSSGSGPVLTDRQLRRRADGVCRSLTELCIALNESSTKMVTASPLQASLGSQSEAVITPSMVVTKSYSTSSSRRASVAPEQIAQGTLSPRAISKFEERRNIILNNGVMATPRTQITSPASPNDAAAAAALSRRSSLLVGRSRRPGAEEVEDGRRSSLLLRSRRTGTEDSEEGRKTSFLVRGRRGTMEDTEDTRFRTPSRATTEVNGTRALAREYVSDARSSRWDESGQAPGILGRHRYLSSNLNHPARTIVPASSAATPVRKYIERSYTLTEASEPPSNDRAASRHVPFSQSAYQKRTNSVSSRRMANRDSLIAPAHSGTDNYR